MRSGADLNATIDYTLKDDKENPTIWKLGILPSSLYNRVLTELSGTAQIYTLVQLGLRGIENSKTTFVTEKTDVLGERRDVVPMRLLDVFDQNDIAELAVQIISINKLSDTERKN